MNFHFAEADNLAASRFSRAKHGLQFAANIFIDAVIGEAYTMTL